MADSPEAPSSPGVNGISEINQDLPKDASKGAAINGHHRRDSELSAGGSELVEQLQKELERTREEKEDMAEQYRSLLARLTTMRSTLGSKLKEDAEELDRREQLLQQYTSQNSALNQTVETLQSELVATNAESERLSKELSSIRSRAYEETAHEATLREREVRDLQAELERCREERDEWERLTQEERIIGDEARAAMEEARKDYEVEHAERERETHELMREREKSVNLQSVLEDFQSGKERELRQALEDHVVQMKQTSKSLAEYKERAHKAEADLQRVDSDGRRTNELETEVKEKNLLIGKLRHEAVILNEHLTEALRRLRKSSSEYNVDRRLVTNVLLTFLTTGRTDGKRYEMLSLLASVLSWDDGEREKAGLQRIGSSSGAASAAAKKASPAGGKIPEDKSEGTESFSKLWVEFLLKESAQGSTDTFSPKRSTFSLPPSPGASHYSPSIGSGLRLPSVSMGSGASAPNLLSPPSRKETS